MALAARDLHVLFGRGENDNQPGRVLPEQALPSRLPVVRPDRLELEYPTLATRLEPEAKILWATMRHPERACFTPALMADGRHFQGWLKEEFGGCGRDEMPFRYLVWNSAAQGAWSMGGDLSTFTRLIRTRDDRALRTYAHRSVDVLFDNYRGLDLPILTVALVQGDAVGGGFEAMVTNDLVVAERGTRFGLPEILFNLFPGMGAYSFLKRRVGGRMARQLIEDGKTRTADELHELGLVDVLCEKGHGEAALRAHIAEREGRFATDLALKRVRQRTDPVTRAELVDIVDLWADLALTLSEADLRRMDCLARHQERRRAGSKVAAA
ncbi:MAG TPA: crotonase/enoyl-CoA hydratase family protein [Geminicoccaceae bacterium]